MADTGVHSDVKDIRRQLRSRLNMHDPSSVPMTYDHGKKAGNLGDVWKHAVLVSIASRIAASAPFRYVESHSGGPYHPLDKAGEWRRGIKVVLEKGDDRDHPSLQMARTSISEGRYEASWLFFARAVESRAPSISAVLCDTSPAVASEYVSLPTEVFPNNLRVDLRPIDGYAHV